MEELAEELRTERETVEKLAGVVPVPVAAMIEGSAWRRSHSIVCPSDLCPSSRVNWKTLAAQMIGMRMRRPRPSTLLWRSLAGGFLTVKEPLGGGGCCHWVSIIAPLVAPLPAPPPPSDVDMGKINQVVVVVCAFEVVGMEFRERKRREAND